MEAEGSGSDARLAAAVASEARAKAERDETRRECETTKEALRLLQQRCVELEQKLTSSQSHQQSYQQKVQTSSSREQQLHPFAVRRDQLLVRVVGILHQRLNQTRQQRQQLRSALRVFYNRVGLVGDCHRCPRQ